MNRSDFKSGLSDLDLAISAHGLAADQDELSPPEGAEGVQVASVGGQAAGRWAAKAFGSERAKLYNRSSRELVKNKPVKPEPTSIDDVNKALDSFGKDKAQPVMGPPEEGMGALADIEHPDQLTALVEQAGSAKFPDQRTWQEVQARTDTVSKVMNELKPITEGRQGGVLSDVQLHGVSRIVATAFDDVESVMAKIAAGTETPEDMLRLATAKNTYEVMHGYLKGQGSEVGRALNSLKMTGEAVKNKDLAAYEKMTSGEQGEQFTGKIKEWADAISRRMAKGDSIGKAMEWGAASLKGDWTRIAVEFWKNNQLSGIKTHVVNNASVMMHGVYENVVIRPTAAAIGAVRTGGRQGADRVHSEELLAPVYSAYAGVRGWTGLFADNFTSGKSAFNALDKVEDSGALKNMINDLPIPGAAKTGLDYATSGSFKLLSATDEAHRGIAFTQELYALSSRQASKEKLTGEAHIRRMNELLDSPPEEMYEAAMTHAKQMTFTDVEQKGWIASTSKALRVMVGEIPPLQFIIPYVNTPSNLLRVGMEMSPLAPLSKRLRDDIAAGGAKGDIAMAKIVAGMGMGALYWQLHEAGVMTGSGPADFRAQEMMKAEGWQPYAITGGESMYGMERMDPFTKSVKFTESLASFAGAMDRAKYAATDEDKENAFLQGVMHLVNGMLEDQWMEQASGFMSAIEGQEAFEKYVARTAAGFIPYHALAKSATDFQQKGRPQLSQDKIKSSIVEMMEDQIRGNFPDLGQPDQHFVRVKRNWDGQVHMPGQGMFSAGASPFPATELELDDLSGALLANGVVPPEPDSVIDLGVKQFSLLQIDPSGRLYDNYIEIVGEQRRIAIREVADHEIQGAMEDAIAEGFKPDGPGSAAQIALLKGIEAGNKAGKGVFFENLKQVMEDNPEIMADSPHAGILAEFVADWELFVEQSVYERDDHWLEGPVQYDPSRGPYDSLIPEMK